MKTLAETASYWYLFINVKNILQECFDMTKIEYLLLYDMFSELKSWKRKVKMEAL